MPRIAYVILCSCLLAAAGPVAMPAGAHEKGYQTEVVLPPPRRPAVWYSSTCCYRKIVRHVGYASQVRYVRIKSSANRPSERERPRKRAAYRDRVSHAAKYDVYVVRRDGRDRCHRRRVRVLGADGDAVWALSARCY